VTAQLVVVLLLSLGPGVHYYWSFISVLNMLFGTPKNVPAVDSRQLSLSIFGQADFVKGRGVYTNLCQRSST
jgi:hypothetical protein